MPDQPLPSRPRRHWFRFALMLLLGGPLLLILLLFVVFTLSHPRADQAAPLDGVLSFKPAAGPAANPSAQSRQASVIFDKWSARHEGKRDWNDLLGKNWRPGQRLTAEQAQWLLDHRELVNDILRIAAAGGVPGLSCEQYSALSYSQQMNHQAPNFLEFMNYATILAAESQRRYDAGDLAGAVDVLLAINPIARSVREPLLVNHLISVAMQARASAELAAWLSDSKLTPDLARKLRDKFAADAITMPDYRRTLDAMYAHSRGMVLEGLTNNNFKLLLTYNLQYAASRNQRRSDSSEAENARLAAKIGAMAAGRTLWMRLTPQRSLDQLDATYRESANKNDPAPEILALFGNELESRVRSSANLAKVNLNVAGLDAIAGEQSAAQTDPFTNQPLKTIEESGSTLIYSLGPDGIDQHGAVSYDPTNGTISHGDIVLRVPKRPN